MSMRVEKRESAALAAGAEVPGPSPGGPPLLCEPLAEVFPFSRTALVLKQEAQPLGSAVVLEWPEASKVPAATSNAGAHLAAVTKLSYVLPVTQRR